MVIVREFSRSANQTFSTESANRSRWTAWAGVVVLRLPSTFAGSHWVGQREHGGGLFSLPKCRAYSLPCYADSAVRRVDKMLYGVK